MAAASISQVHRARLRTGQEVAVKVQRPGIPEEMVSDFLIMMFFAELLERFVPSIRKNRPVMLIREFSRWTDRELYFRQEGKNALPFRRQMNEVLSELHIIRSAGIPFSSMMERLLNTGLDFGIAIPNEFVVMSKAITTLEGTCLSLDPEINIVEYMRAFVQNTMTAGPELDDVQKLLNAVPFDVERLKQLASQYGARAISLLGNPASGVAGDDHRTGRRGTDRSGLDIAHGFIIAALIYAAAILSNESGFEKWLKSVLHLPDLPVLPILCLASSGYLWLRLSRRSRPMKV